MPQLNLIDEQTLAQVQVTLTQPRLSGWTTCTLVAKARRGELLASSGLTIRSYNEAELLPAMLSQVGYGWLYSGCHEAVVSPAAWFRAERTKLRRAW